MVDRNARVKNGSWVSVRVSTVNFTVSADWKTREVNSASVCTRIKKGARK